MARRLARLPPCPPVRDRATRRRCRPGHRRARVRPARPGRRHHAPLGAARRRQRSQRLLANRAGRGRHRVPGRYRREPGPQPTGAEIGRLVDIVCRWTGDETYPPVTGLVVKVGRRLAFVGAAAIDTIHHDGIVLSSARLDLVDFVPRPREVTLFDQVLDHQLVDVDGVQVIRAADLYLAPVYGRYSLVGVDISTQTLLRRLGPARWQHHPTPERVIDWGRSSPSATPSRVPPPKCGSGRRTRDSSGCARASWPTCSRI